MEEKIEKIIKLCQEFCDNEGLSVIVTHGSDFSYFLDTQVIKVNLLEDFQSDYFMENAFNNGLAFDCPHFILAMLHEIGHYYTDKWLSQEDNRKCKRDKRNLDGMKKEDNFKYFNTLDEKLATDWAIEFANTYKEKVEDFSDKLDYLLNDIDENELINFYNDLEDNEVNGIDIQDFLDILMNL